MERFIDRVLSCINEHPEGISDASIYRILDVKYLSQINIYCHNLEAQGYIERRRENGLILNFPTGKVYQKNQTHNKKPRKLLNRSWEDNMHLVAGHLRALGYEIIRTADAASKEIGNDIEAKKDNKELWVIVKGFPMKDRKIHIHSQVAQWFSSVIFDILSRRGENPEVDLAVALPDYPRYRTLSKKVEWLQQPARFSFIWVNEGNSVDWADTSE